MDRAQLLRWSRLDERRRRAASSGLGAVPTWVYSLIGCALVALEVARTYGELGAGARGSSTPLGASNLWLAGLVACNVVVLFGAPFRMYWRRDSALLGRLAIGGDALFGLALFRSVRATVLASLPFVCGAVAFGALDSWDIATRHLAVAGAAAAGSALLGPAVALAAGAIVASDKAQSMINSFGGEFQAPRTSWLGALPAFAATGLALVVIALRPWVQGADHSVVATPMILLVATAGASAAAVAWALSASSSALLAVREVAALDRERLAHIDLTRASPLEKLWQRLLPSRGARLVHDKDVRLARRRFPIPFFVGLVGVLAMWVVAIAGPDDMLIWAGVIAGSVGAYGFVMARRFIAPPIEHRRYLRTLAVGGSAAAAAKRQHVIAWVVTYLAVGAAPIVARAADVLVAGVVLGAIAVATLIASFAAQR